MGRRRRQQNDTINSTLSEDEEIEVKVTMITTAAGPQGVARPGTVLNVPDSEAKELLDKHFARPYDADKDRKSQQGFAAATQQ